MRRRFVVTIVATLVFTLSVVMFIPGVTLGAVTFPDVPQDHPYYAAITGLAERQVICGFADGTFGPAQPVTRQQFSKMVCGVLGLTVQEGQYPCPFDDVEKPAGNPYPDDFIATAYHFGITRGKTATTYDPYSDITRAQVITMVVRAVDNLLPGTLNPVSTGWSGLLSYGDPDHGANIEKAEANGLLATIRGFGGTLANWDTTRQARRAEVAQILWNLMEMIGEEPEPQQGEPVTALQLAISEELEARAASGLPVPESVSYEYSETTDSETGDTILAATTTLNFANPQQAGYTEWPAFEVSIDDFPATAAGPQAADVLLATGSPDTAAGDYSNTVKDALATECPGIWETYTFGQEPREYSFAETSVVPSGLDLDAIVEAQGLSKDTQDIVFGFDWDLEKALGVDLDYTVNWKAKVWGATVFSFKAGFEAGCSLGLRFPMRVDLDLRTPGSGVAEGTSFSPQTKIQGLNWAASDYAYIGLPKENGNEFYFHFRLFAGVQLYIIGLGDVLDGYNIDSTIDKGQSFQTPLGSGTVALDTWRLKPQDTDLQFNIFGTDLGVGVIFTPRVGSDQVRASWEATGQASGSGKLTYTSTSLITLPALVGADDGTAGVRLDDFVYSLNRFLLTLGFWVEIDPPVLSPKATGDYTWDLDLSSVIPSIDVPVYEGTRDYVEADTTVNNVNPTVDAGEDMPAAADTPTTIMATFTDPGLLDTHTAVMTVDGGSPVSSSDLTEPTATSPGLVWFEAEFAAGSHVVVIEVTDDDGGKGWDTLQVTAEGTTNEPPALAAIAFDPENYAFADEQVYAEVRFTDLDGTDGEHWAIWDWGDNTAPTVARADGSTSSAGIEYPEIPTVLPGPVLLTSAATIYSAFISKPYIPDYRPYVWGYHTYDENGVYQVKVKIYDRYGASDEITATFQVGEPEV